MTSACGLLPSSHRTAAMTTSQRKEVRPFAGQRSHGFSINGSWEQHHNDKKGDHIMTTARKTLRTSLAAALLAGVTTLAQGQTGGGDAVTVWNANAGVAATAACIAPLDNPLHESRIYAMMHVAIHDALNAIDRRSRPYTFDMQAEPGASPDAAVAAAARDVLVPLIASTPSRALTLRLASMPALQASKPPIQRRSPRSPMIRPRRRVLRWDRPLLPLSSP